MQGGILSQFIFNVYLDDILYSLEIKGFKCFGYADDLAVLCRSVHDTVKVIKEIE